MTKKDLDIMEENLLACVKKIGEAAVDLRHAENMETSPILVACYVWSKLLEQTIYDTAEQDPKEFGKSPEEYLQQLHQVADIVLKDMKRFKW